ncbi:hypothetical protein [Streptomyces sp. NBC_00439]|uniref:hypothetical protein n=1 Tax=Streptomyces sp. NBC_00439 TaxID=2903650 RepID=UPI00225A08AE|nr:hypothetical protein [Streptomyces sp. NBC_00439]MCX5098629.1 hypothetical protein [Streptomyces sp. NBC_00439]
MSGPPPYFSPLRRVRAAPHGADRHRPARRRAGDPGPELSAELLRAARDGLRGEHTDPRTGRLSPADGLVLSPLHHIGPAPEETGDRRPATGDWETVVALLRRLAARGAARAR